MNYIRAYCQRSPDEEAGQPIRFIASTEGIKRDGKELKASNWQLDNYRKNPVVLWVHDYMGHNLPIGRADVAVESKSLVADVTFDQQDEFARQVESKYRRGFLNAVSVGWGDVMEGKTAFYDLMDISAVPVPADPDALKMQEARALQTVLDALTHIEPDGQRPYPSEHACRLRDPGDFQSDTFRRVSRDSDGKRYDVIMGKLKDENTMTEQAYRYPKDTWDVDSARSHCKSHDGISFEPAKDSERSLLDLSDVDIWDGIATAMVALYQPESTIEDETRQALYIVLERAYRKLNKIAPEFMSREETASLTDTELRGLFLEDEFTRAGAVLSARNRGDLEQAITLIQGVLERAAKEEEKPRTEQDNSTREAIYSIHELFNKEFPK